MPKRMLLGQRFRIGYINAGHNKPFIQNLHECICINSRTSADIQQDCSSFHAAQPCFIHEMPACFAVRQRKCDHISTRKQRIKLVERVHFVHEFRAGSHCPSDAYIVCSEALASFGEFTAYIAETYRQYS